MKKRAIVVLLSAVVSFSAVADDFYDYPAPDDNAGKFYAGLDMASASYGGSFYPSTTGLRVAGGYNFTPELAIEAGYVMLSSSSNNCNYGCGYGGGYGYYGGGGYYGYPYAQPMASYSFNVSSLQLAAVATLPVSDAISLSAKFGMARNSMSYDSTDNNGNNLPTISGSTSNRMFGVGAQYNVGGGFVVRAQYEDLGNLVPGVGMRMISLGGVYNF